MLMGNKPAQDLVAVEEVHARIVAVMEELKLPSPDRMLRRIERMLPGDGRDSVLRDLLQGFEHQSRSDVKKHLKSLAPTREEWLREVDQLFNDYPPT